MRVQIIVGGYTQFLTKAQGMPPHIEAALTKIIREFMWESDSSPRIALGVLQSPIEHGGLNLLDLKARNEAIDIMWLKSYLNFSPSRPTWAAVVDLIIDTSAPANMCNKARGNPFLQTWEIPTKGERTKGLNSDIMRMVAVARKHNVNIAAISLSTKLKKQLPAWYHIAADPRPITNVASICLLNNHDTTKVADLLQISARLRDQPQNQTHLRGPQCVCRECVQDRRKGCKDPNACAEEAQLRINRIAPKMNPTLAEGNRDGLSLTRTRKTNNELARQTNGTILFDPSVTCKDDLAECFRIFTNPDRITNIPAKRLQPRGVALRDQQIEAYTDGACYNNGKANAQCGSGIWFGPGQERNRAIKVPGREQSNQVGELIAIIIAAEAVPQSWPLKIHSDSRYAIDGLTKHLRTWEDNGWINVKNANIFKKAAYVLKRRTAPTSFQWVKGHSGNEGNEESDGLAKEGANKIEPDEVDLSIPKDFDLQGAKLSAITQVVAYRGILEQRRPYARPSTSENLQKARTAVIEYTQQTETDGTLWRGLQKSSIKIKIRQFLYKAMHETQKIGHFWTHIPGYEERQYCPTCRATETMEHILTTCATPARRIIWNLAEEIWPQENPRWPEISIGIVLGCGGITSIKPQNPNNEERGRRTNSGAVRLLQILLTESAHLIWVLRCERVIQQKDHSENEIRNRWLSNINRRLTEDKIIATKIKRSKNIMNKVKGTWEGVLSKTWTLPDEWLEHREFLVGRRA